jgi:hypothetical protein
MSLSVSGMSSSSSDSASTSSIPKIPNDRALFDNWRMVMRAYLDDKGVWSVVSAGEVGSVSAAASSSSSSSSSSKGITKGKDDTDDSEASQVSPSPGAEDPEVSKFKKKAWSILMQSFSKPTHYDHARQVPEGDPAALWNRLIKSYGIVRTAESKAALRTQLYRSNRKTAKQTMDDYIAHTDKLIFDLKSAGEIVSNSERKFFILEGLAGIPEWELIVDYSQTGCG